MNKVTNPFDLETKRHYIIHEADNGFMVEVKHPNNLNKIMAEAMAAGMNAGDGEEWKMKLRQPQYEMFVFDSIEKVLAFIQERTLTTIE